jgi:hypothetical protein
MTALNLPPRISPKARRSGSAELPTALAPGGTAEFRKRTRSAATISVAIP